MNDQSSTLPHREYGAQLIQTLISMYPFRMLTDTRTIDIQFTNRHTRLSTQLISMKLAVILGLVVGNTGGNYNNCQTRTLIYR